MQHHNLHVNHYFVHCDRPLHCIAAHLWQPNWNIHILWANDYYNIQKQLQEFTMCSMLYPIQTPTWLNCSMLWIFASNSSSQTAWASFATITILEKNVTITFKLGIRFFNCYKSCTTKISGTNLQLKNVMTNYRHSNAATPYDLQSFDYCLWWNNLRNVSIHRIVLG